MATWSEPPNKTPKRTRDLIGKIAALAAGITVGLAIAATADLAAGSQQQTTGTTQPTLTLNVTGHPGKPELTWKGLTANG
jgi:hypothetical protein